MKTGTVAALGIGVGAGLMYWWDPVRGRARRARLGQTVSRGAHEALDEADKGVRDLAHRTQGLAARSRSWLRRRPASDEEVIERVRSRLGRASSHPRAIEVAAREGRVDLRGPVLASEVDEVLLDVARVPGVKGVESHLEVHAEPGNVTALQGGEAASRAAGRGSAPWTPATRLLAAAIGVGLLSRPGPLSRLAGAGLLTRSLVNHPFRRLIGIGAGPHGVDVRKSIHVEAPVEEVFAFWRQPESFPRFMSHVKEVQRTDGDRYHWKVRGPAGIDLEWDAEVTALDPDRLIAWQSVPGSTVESEGAVRFKRRGNGADVEVSLSYNPPAGVLGHGIATLLGLDPKAQMDDDLLRLKSLLEQGKATGRQETVTREEVSPR